MSGDKLFGWTAPTQEPGEQFVRYLMAFDEHPLTRIEIRDGSGRIYEIRLDRNMALSLARLLEPNAGPVRVEIKAPPLAGVGGAAHIDVASSGVIELPPFGALQLAAQLRR